MRKASAGEIDTKKNRGKDIRNKEKNGMLKPLNITS